MRVVSRELTMRLLSYGVNFNNTHIIGHSLGAHLSGYIGKEVQNRTNDKVERITGLDPAGPGFDFPLEWYEKYDNLTLAHLWHTDAEFVDVIHTGNFKNNITYII